MNVLARFLAGGPPLGDMASWPLFTIQASMAAVWICVALAVGSGGIWVARRFQGRPTASFRKFCLLSLGIGAWAAASTSGWYAFAFHYEPAGVASDAFAVGGLLLVFWAYATSAV